jgi:hypothetical protein
MTILLFVAAATTVACGGESGFEGTWVRPGQPGAWVIEKSGDDYSVTAKASVEDENGLTFTATVDGDSLKIADPTGDNPEVITVTISGDQLTYSKSGEKSITLERQK